MSEPRKWEVVVDLYDCMVWSPDPLKRRKPAASFVKYRRLGSRGRWTRFILENPGAISRAEDLVEMVETHADSGLGAT